MLREHFCFLFAHAFRHEDARAILNDEGPAHDLCSHIEELSNHTFAVAAQTKNALDGWEEVDVVALVGILRHLFEKDDEEHDDDDDADEQVRGDEYAEVAILHGIEFGRAKQGALLGAGRVEASLYEIHGNEHADDTAAWVEALGKVESSSGGFFRTHRENIRVATGFEERQSAGHDEVSNEEATVGANHLRRKEEQGTCGIESESHQHTCLVAIFADEDGCRECHAEVASIERQLYERTFRDTHAENLGEGLYHGIGDVVGKSPKGEAEGDKDERNEIADTILLD